MISIRRMRADDAPAVADLTTALGYPVDASEMASRTAPILQRDDHLLLVATDASDRPVGWIHAHRRLTLEAPEHGVISGLVVGDGARDRGAGTELVKAAERWARSCGLTTMLVRSRSTRTRAHRFYERIGYVEIKRSHVFEKPLV